MSVLLRQPHGFEGFGAVPEELLIRTTCAPATVYDLVELVVGARGPRRGP